MTNSNSMSRFRFRTLGILVAAALLVAAVAFTAGVRAADTSTPVAFIVDGENWPDGLTSASPAALNTGPVLLTRQNSLPAATIAELQRLKPDRIVIAGGPAAVSAAVENALKAYAPVVDRIAGHDRYETAAEISEAFFPATLPVGPAGPQGPAGPEGPEGPQGPPGMSGYEVITETADNVDVNGGQLVQLTASCGSKIPIGGGFIAASLARLGTFVVEDSFPKGNEWEVAWRNTSNAEKAGSFEMFAICATIAP